MTEQEKINSEVQTKLALHDAKFAIAMEELKQQREDIRQLNTRMDAMNTRIDSKFDNLSNQIHSLTVAAVVGFGALVLAVGGLAASVSK